MNPRNRVLGVSVLILVLGTGESGEISLGGSEENQSRTAKRLIAELSSPEISAEEMEDAEAKLQKMAPQVVLPALVPRIAQGMPGGFGIWNGSGTAKGDAGAPPKWRAFYSYHRVWGQVAPRDSKLTARLLAEHLSSAKTSKEQAALISQLERYWDDAAEKSIASILRKFRDGESPWLPAARCLMQHKREKYYDDLKQIARQLPAGTWQQMLTKASTVQLLLSERATAHRRNETGLLDPLPLPRLDSELLATGFELLKAMEGHKKGFGYFLALNLGDYVGQDFQPNREDDNYKGENGLKDVFFAHSSENALEWWEKNKQKHVRESQ